MNGVLHCGILFASGNRMDHLVDSIGSGFRDRQVHFSTREMMVWVLIVIAAALLTWLVVRVARWIVKHLRNGPLWLFIRLCQAHGLPWSDRWLLWQLAAYQQLRDPAYLFIDPDRWEDARIDPRLLIQSARLTELRERLFCDLPARVQARLGTPLAPAAPTEPPSHRTGAACVPPPTVDLADWLRASEGATSTSGGWQG